MADLAQGSRHSLAYVAETTAGTTPSSPVFQTLRHTSDSLTLSKNTMQSEELRGDRQIAHFRHGVRQVGGDIGAELSFGTFDELIEAALCGDWVTDTPTSGEDTLKAGTKRRSFTFEGHMEDKGQYFRRKGCEINTLSLSFSTDSRITTTFGILGRDADAPAQSSITGATYTGVSTNEPMSSPEASIKEGGSTIAAVTELSLSLQNGIEGQNAIGSNHPESLSIGQSNVSGTMTVYFVDETLMNKFINETESSLAVTVDDGTNQYEISLPRIKYTGGYPEVGGPGVVTVSMPFQALYDENEDTQIKIVRGPV